MEPLWSALALLALPLDVSSYCLESLYARPYALPVLIGLACTPPSYLTQCAQLARAYPLVTLALASVTTLVCLVAWLLFGALLGALGTTLWLLLWYAPLLLALGRTLWIVCRRYLSRVTARLGWRNRIDETTASVRESVQTRMANVAQAALAYALRLAAGAQQQQKQPETV